MTCATLQEVDRVNYCCYLKNKGEYNGCECKDHPVFKANCSFENGIEAKGLCKFYNVSQISKCNNSMYKITINNKVIGNG